MIDINKYINESLFSRKSEEDVISAVKREIALEELKKYGYDLIPSRRKKFSPLNPKVISKQVEVTLEGKIKITLAHNYYLLSIENIKNQLKNSLSIIDIEYPGNLGSYPTGVNINLMIMNNPGLTTLEDIFDPAAEINTNLNIYDCENLQSLKGLPKFETPGRLYISNCPYCNLEGLEKNSKYDYIRIENPVKNPVTILQDHFYEYIKSHNIKVEDFDIY